MQKYAGTIITWLICQQAIQERDRELYTYALYNMVLLIIPLGLAVMFGWIIGNIRQAIVMIIPFMMLRKFSGGFHAKTPLRCMAISSFLLFLCIKIIFELSCNWKLLIVTAIMGGSLIIFSPVDSQKRRLEKQQKEQYRKVVCEFVMFFLILIFILWKLNAQKYAVSIADGIWLSAGLQIPCLIKQLTLVKNGRKILFRL